MKNKFLICVICLLVCFSCKKREQVICRASFEIDGIEYIVNGGGVSCAEHYDVNKTPVFYNYYWMDGAYYGGQMVVEGHNDMLICFELRDSTFSANTTFNLSNGLTGFYFAKNSNIYHARQGNMTLKKEGEFSLKKRDYDQDVEVSGTFNFTMVNILDDTDTVIIKNGKYVYNYVSYMKVYQK
jgi:hypothetical protein